MKLRKLLAKGLIKSILTPYRDLYLYQKKVSAKLDPDFTSESFKQGATAALLAVTDILASDDVSALKENGFLSTSAYQVFKAGHEELSNCQRRKLHFREQDIEDKDILNLRIIQDEVTGVRAVEIVVGTIIVKDLDHAAKSKIVQMIDITSASYILIDQHLEILIGGAFTSRPQKTS